jgi:hypothetical protein
MILVSGCSTMPVPPPSLQKPVTCLLPVPDTLALLPPGFEAYSLPDKAVSLLDLHTQDGATYATAVTQLHDCQNFIRGLP